MALRPLSGNAPDFAVVLEQYARLLRKMENVAQAEAMETRVSSIRARNAYTVSTGQLPK